MKSQPKQRHRERLDQPVDAHRRGYAAPVAFDLTECGKIDLQQHGYDHQPDQHGNRQVDLRDRCRAERMEQKLGTARPRAMPTTMQRATQSVR